MSGAPGGNAGPIRPPDAADLERLDGDAWAVVVAHARGALRDVEDEHADATVRRLRATPPSKLATGRSRRDLCRLLAAGGPVWRQLHRRLSEEGAPRELEWLVAGQRRPDQPARASGASRGEDQPPSDGRAAARRLKQRARTMQEERDAARRQLDGERTRSAALEAALADVRRDLRDARAEADQLHDRLAAATAERDVAVERERRRHTAEAAGLRGELRQLRRQLESLRSEQRPAAGPDRPPPPSPSEPAAPADAAFVPGRPTRTPPGVVAGSTEHARLFLHAGRTIVVDGYNVTRQHRGDLDLEGQRGWLTRLVTAAAARNGVAPVLVWDGQGATGRTPSRVPRGIDVRFTGRNVSADDDIVFVVAALPPDQPVAVVTDDRELRARLAPYAVDLIPTAAFVWAALA